MRLLALFTFGVGATVFAYWAVGRILTALAALMDDGTDQ